jgi:hypothetical protein
MSDSKKLIPITILEWRPLAKGSLLGFVKIQMGALQITDVTVMSSGGRKWAGLPAKPQIDKDGNVKRDGSKIMYAKILSWDTKTAADRFSDSVIAALELEYPGAAG